jgi:hypothetical protein
MALQKTTGQSHRMAYRAQGAIYLTTAQRAPLRRQDLSRKGSLCDSTF